MKLEKYWTDKTLNMNIHCTYTAALSFAVVWTVHQHSLLLGPKSSAKHSFGAHASYLKKWEME